MSMHRLALAMPLLVVMALCFSCSGKGDHRIYLQGKVNDVKGLTLPSGASLTNDSGLSLSGFSAAASWEFATHEERKAYLSWVREKLERADFKLQSSNDSSLLLIKTSRDEAESIKIEVTPANPGLRVQIAFAIDSD